MQLLRVRKKRSNPEPRKPVKHARGAADFGLEGVENFADTVESPVDYRTSFVSIPPPFALMGGFACHD